LRAPHVVLRGAVTPTPRFIAIERAIRAAPIRLSLYARRSPALTSSCRASRTCATSLPPLRAAFFHPASALGRKHHLCNSRTRCCLRPASRNAPVPCFGGHRRKRRPVRWTRPVHAPCSVIQKAKEEAVAPVALLPQIETSGAGASMRRGTRWAEPRPLAAKLTVESRHAAAGRSTFFSSFWSIPAHAHAWTSRLRSLDHGISLACLPETERKRNQPSFDWSCPGTAGHSLRRRKAAKWCRGTGKDGINAPPVRISA
jgi:hypothetical protein